MSRSFDFEPIKLTAAEFAEYHQEAKSQVVTTEQESVVQASKVDPRSKLKHMRVLVVEDCPDQQRLIVNVLARYGASVHLECNGDAAVVTEMKAIDRGSPFNAIIMDLYLTSSNGMDATRQIIALDPQALVIAITAHGSPEIEREWRDAGCAAYLEKPIDISLLLDALASVETITA